MSHPRVRNGARNGNVLMRQRDRNTILWALFGTGITFCIFLFWPIVPSRRDKYEKVLANPPHRPANTTHYRYPPNRKSQIANPKSSHYHCVKQAVARAHGISHLRGGFANAKISICGVTSFFNPAAFKSKLTNYKRFAQRVRKQGVFLITVELTFDEREYEISESAADIIVRRRVPLDTGAMWQKERYALLYNDLSMPQSCGHAISVDAEHHAPTNARPQTLEPGR